MTSITDFSTLKSMKKQKKSSLGGVVHSFIFFHVLKGASLCHLQC